MAQIKDDDSNPNGKVSVCYGCGSPLRNVSILVCAECLNTECEDFVELTEIKKE